MTLKDTSKIFADDLRDPEYAAGYLNLALEDDGVDGFLYALQKVASAHGIRDVATLSGIPRESLYRSLSDKGNPGIRPLARVMNAVGLRLAVTAKAPTQESSAPTEPVPTYILADITAEVAALRRALADAAAARNRKLCAARPRKRRVMPTAQEA